MTIIAPKTPCHLPTLLTISICVLSILPNCASEVTKTPKENVNESSSRPPAEVAAPPPPPQPKSPSLHRSNLSTAHLDGLASSSSSSPQIASSSPPTITFEKLTKNLSPDDGHDPEWKPPAPTEPPKECAESLFRCATPRSDGGVQCIPISWKCDRESDCADGSDEDDAKCPPATCRYFIQ